MEPLIPAAGGAVFRHTREGPQVLLVHRPRYDDWTLPKGKNDPGESAEQAAVREVEEETGQRARIVGPLGETRYPVAGGLKVVSWFVMEPVEPGAFLPHEEVDEIRWLGIPEARALLTYERDQGILERLESDSHLRTGTLYLLRHGAAGDRTEWQGPDRDRPLSKKGRRQAQAMLELLGEYEIERILSSPYLRCVQSVEPLAAALGLEIETAEGLAEGSENEALSLVEGVIGRNTLLCSHGDVIPWLLEAFAEQGLALPSLVECRKGSTWVVEVKAGRYTAADYLPPPQT